MHPAARSAIDWDDGQLGREVLMLNGRPGCEKRTPLKKSDRFNREIDTETKSPMLSVNLVIKLYFEVRTDQTSEQLNEQFSN
jgi:hypothetical protein